MTRKGLKDDFWIPIILFSLPFLQLGLTFYESVSFITFLLFFFFSLKLSIINQKVFVFSLIALFLFLTKAIIVSVKTVDIRNSLIPIRELVCFIGLVFIVNRIRFLKIDQLLTLRFLNTLIFGLGLFVLVQYYFISKGVYFGFPIDYFVMNQATLETSELALNAGTRYRPTAFYGEPSYAGWITFSLLAMALNFRNKRNGFALIIISVIISILLESFSGIIAVVIYSIFWLSKVNQFNFRSLLKISRAILVLVICFAGFYFFSSSFKGRFDNAQGYSDVSINIRLLNPVAYLNNMLDKGEIFGVYNFGDLTIDNAAWSMLIQYGIISFPIFYLLLKYTFSGILSVIYILLAFNFNGTVLSFDKVIVIGLVIGLQQNRELLDKKEVKSRV